MIDSQSTAVTPTEVETRPISIVIPTYKREQVLIDTIRYLDALPIKAAEIIVVDQTPDELHELSTIRTLDDFNRQGVIRLIKKQPPSITEAMEEGLLNAREDIVLFVDDDIIPDETLVDAHFKAQLEYGPNTVVNGRVQQPWDDNDDKPSANPFRFHDRRALTEIAGGNFSVRVEDWKRVGGFDKHFSKVAYRFEKDFAQRFIREGGAIWLEPDAGIIHLHAKEGGTRSWGDVHERPRVTPDQSVGQFYYIFSHEPKSTWLAQIARFYRTTLINRTTLKRPWHIPVHVVGLTRGLWLGWRQYQSGPRLYSQHS